jgi:hypothetical protein
MTENYQDQAARERDRQQEALRQLVEDQRAEPVSSTGRPKTRAQKRAQRAQRGRHAVFIARK